MGVGIAHAVESAGTGDSQVPDQRSQSAHFFHGCQRVQGSSQSARKVVGVVEKVCVYSGVLGLVRARPRFFAVIQRAGWVLLSRTFPSQPFGGC
jgi:hypothetical protein